MSVNSPRPASTAFLTPHDPSRPLHLRPPYVNLNLNPAKVTSWAGKGPGILPNAYCASPYRPCGGANPPSLSKISFPSVSLRLTQKGKRPGLDTWKLPLGPPYYVYGGENLTATPTPVDPCELGFD